MTISNYCKKKSRSQEKNELQKYTKSHDEAAILLCTRILAYRGLCERCIALTEPTIVGKESSVYVLLPCICKKHKCTRITYYTGASTGVIHTVNQLFVLAPKCRDIVPGSSTHVWGGTFNDIHSS